MSLQGEGVSHYYDKLKPAFRLWYCKRNPPGAVSLSPLHPQPPSSSLKWCMDARPSVVLRDGLRHFRENFSSWPPLSRSLSKTLFNIVMETERHGEKWTSLDDLMYMRWSPGHFERKIRDGWHSCCWIQTGRCTLSRPLWKELQIRSGHSGIPADFCGCREVIILLERYQTTCRCLIHLDGPYTTHRPW